MTTTYEVGDRVTIKKYGDTYPAVVTKVGRTTVTVEFTTKGRKVKTYTVPGYDVRYVLAARP